MYQVDPNDNTKQVPKTPDFKSIKNKVIQPAPLVLQEKPNGVILHAAGQYVFMYEASASIGTTVGTHQGTGINTFISGSKIGNAGQGGVELPIQPVAWSSNGGAAGDVTFVYRGRV